MDVSSLDYTHGQHLEAQVWHKFGSPVVSSSLDYASHFWLLAAVSRSRLRLSAQSVGSVLQSVLGGPATSFAVVEVEDGIFKFSVISSVLASLSITSSSLKAQRLRFSSISGMKMV